MGLTLGLDVAKAATGLVVYDPQRKRVEHANTITNVTPLTLYQELVRVSSLFPEIDRVITAHATFNTNVIRGHARFHGVMEMWAEQYMISFFYCPESNAKKIVTGKCLSGKAGKDATRKHFAHLTELTTQDECDAMLFITWDILSTN